MRRFATLTLALLLCAPLAAQVTVQSPADVHEGAGLWNMLMAGNRNYVAGTVTYDELKQERAAYKEKQHPPVTVLSCSDSRVPPELVFSQSLGALFVVRSAGNIADTYGIASIEFAIANGYTKLIVVLGHDECGAVKSSLATEDPISPHLLALVQRVRASFVNIPYKYDDPAVVRRAVEANTRASAAALLAQSKIIRDAVVAGKVEVVTAVYSLATGEVRKLD